MLWSFRDSHMSYSEQLDNLVCKSYALISMSFFIIMRRCGPCSAGIAAGGCSHGQVRCRLCERPNGSRRLRCAGGTVHWSPDNVTGPLQSRQYGEIHLPPSTEWVHYGSGDDHWHESGETPHPHRCATSVRDDVAPTASCSQYSTTLGRYACCGDRSRVLLVSQTVLCLAWGRRTG
jgi:hypothetical protein